MPLFEYFCAACKKDFALLQSASVNKGETACPDCGGNQVEYKFSTFASKVAGSSRTAQAKPLTMDEMPDKKVFNLPIPSVLPE